MLHGASCSLFGHYGSLHFPRHVMARAAAATNGRKQQSVTLASKVCPLLSCCESALLATLDKELFDLCCMFRTSYIDQLAKTKAQYNGLLFVYA